MKASLTEDEMHWSRKPVHFGF